MDFSPDISQIIDSLSKKCLEKRKVLQDFIGLLQTRAELEEFYSRSIEKIADSLTKLIHGKDSIKELFLILRNYFHIQTEQSRTLARQIKNDVISELETHLLEEGQWQKEIGILKQKHQKEIRRNIDNLNLLRDEYIQSINEEKQFQLNKSIQKKLSYHQCEIKLHNFIAYYNQYIEQYFQDIAIVQDKFQSIELERRKKVQDSTIKYFMFEISFIRNLQYDLNGISQKSEQYNPKNDLQNLFKDYPTDKPLISKLNFENYKSFIHSQLDFKPQVQTKKKKPIFDSQPFEEVQQQNLNQKESNLNQKETNQVYLKLFQNALFNNVITDESIMKLNELLEETKPIIYIQSLQKILKLQLHSDENNDNLTEYTISPEAYVSLLKLIMTLLDFCNQKNDYAEIILETYDLSKSIIKVLSLPNQETIKMPLFEGLINHPVLNNQHIWLNYTVLFQQTLGDKMSVFSENNVTEKSTQLQIQQFLQRLQNINCNQQIIEQIQIQLNYSLVQENPFQ